MIKTGDLMEILEWLRESAGCRYISDLRYGINNEIAKPL